MTLKTFNTLLGSSYETWEELLLNTSEDTVLSYYSDIPGHYRYTIVHKRQFSDNCLEKHLNLLDWYSISAFETLPINFIRKYKDKIIWTIFTDHMPIKDDFIKEFSDKIDWDSLSRREELSEDLIREYQDKINWDEISRIRYLSVPFIEEFQDKLNFFFLSYNSPLSESLINAHKDDVFWLDISAKQKLSESFIIENLKRVNMPRIIGNQKLSESFIKNYVSSTCYLKYCLTYQGVSLEFIEDLKIKDPSHFQIYKPIIAQYYGIYFDPKYKELAEDCWLNKSTEYKKQMVQATHLYECYEDYFIAYKGIRKDRYSCFNFQYQYFPNHTYEAWCDTSNNENSFGLSAWTKEEAIEYCPELVVRVKIRYEDVGRVVHNGGKIRCFKFKVLD